LTAAKDMASKAAELGPAAMKAKQQLTEKWTEARQTVPKMMNEVQARANALRQAGKLPKEASGHFTSAKASWMEALESFKSGHLAEAMAKANMAKNDLTEAAHALGIKVAAITK
jgi:hypothetical protein